MPPLTVPLCVLMSESWVALGPYNQTQRWAFRRALRLSPCGLVLRVLCMVFCCEGHPVSLPHGPSVFFALASFTVVTLLCRCNGVPFGGEGLAHVGHGAMMEWGTSFVVM